MADNRAITCTNEDNVAFTFSRTSAPFVLIECDGIYEVSNDVSTSANTMTDGSTYLGTVTQMRNIVLTIRDRPGTDHRYNRDFLYTLFKSKSAGTFLYEEDDTERQIGYYVESVDITNSTSSRTATVSLLCPDPFFADTDDVSVILAGWEGAFEFQHEFVNGGEELGDRVLEKSASIANESAADNIGLTITITAYNTVVNPSITHVEQGITMQIGTEDYPYTMEYGEKIVITTETGNKHIYSVIDGVQTEINEYLSADSEFIQLMSGSNNIGYTADEGEEYMGVTITYRYRYAGA